MEGITLIIFIITVYCLANMEEWKSNNRLTPPGKKTDYMAANSDIIRYGKEYYYRQNIAGKYDIPDDK